MLLEEFIINMELFANPETILYMFTGLEWFLVSFAVAILWTAYLTIVADIKFIFRLVAIPAWLVFTISLMITLDGFMGKPYPGVPPQAQVIQFRIVKMIGKDEALIEAWMYLTKDRVSKLYRFPHTPKREQALRKALGMQVRGQKVEIDFTPERAEIPGNEVQVEDMLNYDIRHRGLPTKPQEEVAPAPTAVQPADDSTYMIQLPDGGQLQIEPGTTIYITPDGEIQLSTPTLQQEINPETGMPRRR